MEYITSKEEFLDNIIWDNYTYEIKFIQLYDFSLELLEVTLKVRGNNIKMQPFIIGNCSEIEYKSRKLWLNNYNKREKSQNTSNRNFSLKLDVIEPFFRKMVSGNTYEHILEVGSTETFISHEIVDTIFGKKYFGIDISVPISDHKNLNFSYIKGFTEEIPIITGKIDFLLCSMVLLNIAKPENAIKEFSNILKNNGTLVVIDINAEFYKACGFYQNTKKGYLFTKVVDTNKLFFTLKILGRNNFFIHCYHPYNLYRDILLENKFSISADVNFGPTADLILEKSSTPKKDIKAFSRYIKYPPFHYIQAEKNNV